VHLLVYLTTTLHFKEKVPKNEHRQVKHRHLSSIINK